MNYFKSHFQSLWEKQRHRLLGAGQLPLAQSRSPAWVPAPHDTLDAPGSLAARLSQVDEIGLVLVLVFFF